MTECREHEHVKSVTTITEVFGDGQKLTAVAVEYDKEIDNVKLRSSVFSVDGRTITKTYANIVAAKSSQGTDGRYVIIELSIHDEEASTIIKIQKDNKTERYRREIKVSVMQLGHVITTEGETYPSDTNIMMSNKEINLTVDNFLELEFNDIKTGEKLKYNLFIPRQYDSNKSYPMVVFIHDMGACSRKSNLALIQGLGGVIWASPSEQAKHECFVLAPQYPSAIVNDKFETTKYFDITVELINFIVNQYSIDRNRLYATGQSMGCMSLTEMSIQYPDMFAAVLLCAGQWNQQTISVLANNNMWVLVSGGDEKAFKGMNACMGSLESAGAKISRAKWNGRLGGEEFTVAINKVIEEGNNIKYTVFENGTVVPIEEQGKNVSGESLDNHRHTWRLVYTIEGLRDWLFTQEKSLRS